MDYSPAYVTEEVGLILFAIQAACLQEPPLRIADAEFAVNLFGYLAGLTTGDLQIEELQKMRELLVDWKFLTVKVISDGATYRLTALGKKDLKRLMNSSPAVVSIQERIHAASAAAQHPTVIVVNTEEKNMTTKKWRVCNDHGDGDLTGTGDWPGGEYEEPLTTRKEAIAVAKEMSRKWHGDWVVCELLPDWELRESYRVAGVSLDDEDEETVKLYDEVEKFLEGK